MIGVSAWENGSGDHRRANSGEWRGPDQGTHGTISGPYRKLLFVILRPPLLFRPPLLLAYILTLS